MEWRGLIVLAAEAPSGAESSSDSITVALIAALGTVAVAVIGLFAQMLSKSRTTESPPAPVPAVDPRIGETVAVAAARLHDARSTLNIQDHRLDAMEDRLERMEWTLEQMARQLGGLR